MYGQLEYYPDRTQAPWVVTYFTWPDRTPPNLTPAQAGDRGRALKQISTDVADLTDVQRKDLIKVATGLPASAVDLVSDLYLALAHLRLPQVQREAREARIKSTLDAHFNGVQTVPAMTVGLQYIQLLAPLVPDACLDVLLRSKAALLEMVSMGHSDWMDQCQTFLDRFYPLSSGLGFESGSPVDLYLSETFFTRSWADRPAFLELLELAVRNHLARAVLSTHAALINERLLTAAGCDILVGVLQDCQAAGLDGSMQSAIDAVVANQLAMGREAEVARLTSVVQATINATLMGIPMGAQAREKNLKAAMASQQVSSQNLLRMTPARLRMHKKLVQAPTPVKSIAPCDPPDLDPVSAWSVSRLLRWIEGPISEAAPKRLDRNAIVAAEKTNRQNARGNAKKPQTVQRDDQDLTEADVDIAVQDALRTTAGFFIGDIQDMLFRAKVLDNACAALKTCADLLDPLQKLTVGLDFDDQKARTILHEAEVAIELLRKDIQVKETDARTRQRFAQQLRIALSKESMVEGKRHGGVINCPLHRTDWPWVAEQYNRRWLPWNNQITIDGVSQPLPRDHALGLYVTGKSLSGYEFDVSVHLWQRKVGRNGEPGTSPTSYAPMNTEDWVDTLIPCTVLHVPSAG